MKILPVLFILFFPIFSISQTKVKLNVNQPPEFGYSIFNNDTTVVKGSSVVLANEINVFGGSGEYKYRWSPSISLNDSTVANPIATPLDTTIYTLTVTDKNGCSFCVNYTVNTKNPLVGLDLASLTRPLNVVLFPNPNDGKFAIKIKGLPADVIELTIFDSTGKIMVTQTIDDFQGEHTELVQLKQKGGVYTLHIKMGAETQSSQFIIN